MVNVAKKNGFYHSSLWRKTRKAYFQSAFGLCERCGNAGKIVHHKIHLNESNYNDEEVLLGMQNLELLCKQCHEAEHRPSLGVSEKYYFTFDGELKMK